MSSCASLSGCSTACPAAAAAAAAACARLAHGDGRVIRRLLQRQALLEWCLQLRQRAARARATVVWRVVHLRALRRVAVQAALAWGVVAQLAVHWHAARWRTVCSAGSAPASSVAARCAARCASASLLFVAVGLLLGSLHTCVLRAGAHNSVLLSERGEAAAAARHGWWRVGGADERLRAAARRTPLAAPFSRSAAP